MLEKLRQRAREALATTRQIVLSSYGPADIQTEIVACEALGLALYVLVPRASDLLFNLESDTRVVATADSWQVRGVASRVPPGACPDQLALAGAPAAAWCEVVEIRPTRLHLRALVGQGQGETIDL